jgi:hypothetical protein
MKKRKKKCTQDLIQAKKKFLRGFLVVFFSADVKVWTLIIDVQKEVLLFL